MPIYEYRCGECRKKFELIFLGSGAGDEVACPKCGASEVERLVSRFSTPARSDSGDDWGGEFPGGEDDFDGAGDFGEEDGPGGYGGGRGGAAGFDDDDTDEDEGGWGEPREDAGGEEGDEDDEGGDDYDDEEDS